MKMGELSSLDELDENDMGRRRLSASRISI